tara:strand:+ start:12940 stop:13854 length:915 start_codon:yes stop_codon:yes gene_type:complete
MAVTGKFSSVVVVIIIYNRPNYLKKLLKKLNKFELSRIYIISDGPKNDPNDINLVKKTRNLINDICKRKKIFKIYSKNNLGLRKSIITGLNQVFKREKQAIILEDDCIPTKEFFLLTKILLKKFKNNKDIVSICGSNHLSYWDKGNTYYLQSKYFNSWGWATWSDRWKQINFNPKYLLNKNNNKKILNRLGSYRALFYWRYILKKILHKKINSWAYTYNYYYFLRKKYHLIPTKNLIKNIGIGKNSTNTKKLPVKYSFKKFTKNKYSFSNLIRNRSKSIKYDKEVEDRVFSKSLINRIKWFFSN